MTRHLLVAVGLTLIFIDHFFVSSFIRSSHYNSCSATGSERCKTELMQQKKRAPVGGEFIELGSSLITLLNLAQEIGSSNNLRFRQAADKLRDQFARSFALRYDLEKSQFLSSALSSIDGDSQLTAAQRAIQATVMAQLKGIERKASSIIFFNEPLGNLNEFQYPFSFPYSALEPLAQLPNDTTADSSLSNVPTDSVRSKITAEAEMIRKRDARNLQFFRDRIPSVVDSRYRDEDIRKLKLGLQVETRKWRAEAAKLMRTRGQQYSIGVNSNDKQWTLTADEEASSQNTAGGSDSPSDDWNWNSRFRPLAFDPPVGAQGQGGGKGQGAVAGSVSMTELKQRRQHQRASGGRWRASLELIDSAKERRAGTEDPDADADVEAEADMPIKREGTGTGLGGAGELDPSATNYALLIHSCLLLSLSTYNLKLTGDWIDFAFDIDSERAIEKISEAVSKAADALALTMNMSGRRESKESIASPVGSTPANAKAPSLSDSLKDADMARTQALVFKALGGSSFPRDALFVQTIHSDKACAVMLYDQRRNTVIIAFRGTKDPVDVITDITFFSTAFAPRPVVKADPKSEGTFSSNAAVLISRDPPSSLPPLFSTPSPSPPLEAESESAGGYPEGMEVHTGFLSSFESIRGKIDIALARLNVTVRSSALTTSSSQPTVLLTGHSMGGALAQIAAAYYSDLKPSLVTFATPSIGNEEFCSFVNRKVQPAGGLRVWNEYDAIPYIALLVGYQHAGVPIKTRLKKNAKDLFQNVSVNTIAAALDVVSPHILFQIGSLIHVFPVIGSEIGNKHAQFASASDSSSDLEYLEGDRIGSSTRPSSISPPPPPPPPPSPQSPAVSSRVSQVASAVTGTTDTALTVVADTEEGSESEHQGMRVVNVAEDEKIAEAVATSVGIQVTATGTSDGTLTSTPTATIVPPNPNPSPDLPTLLTSPPFGNISILPAAPDSDPGAAKKPSFFGIGFDRIFGRRAVEDNDSPIGTQTGDGALGGEKGNNSERGRGGVGIPGNGADSSTSVGVGVPVPTGSSSTSTSSPDSLRAVRGYSFTAEELEQEQEQEEGAVGTTQVDGRVGGKSAKSFPEHPAFQPVFSIVKKDKTEDFTPDSYYDQFINEKQYFLSSDQTQIGYDETRASGTDSTGVDNGQEIEKGEGQWEDKSALNLSFQVRRIMRELEEEAVFSEIDNSARRGIMLRIWEEIKDSEATLISSLGKQVEEGDEGDDEDDDDDDEEDDDDDEEQNGD